MARVLIVLVLVQTHVLPHRRLLAHPSMHLGVILAAQTALHALRVRTQPIVHLYVLEYGVVRSINKPPADQRSLESFMLLLH